MSPARRTFVRSFGLSVGPGLVLAIANLIAAGVDVLFARLKMS